MEPQKHTGEGQKTSAEFEALCCAQYQRMYTLAFRMTGSRQDTEDVLQAALLSAWKGWSGFRGESRAETWLYRVVVNTAKRAMKKARRLPVAIAADEHNVTEGDVYDWINRSGTCEDEYLVERVRQSCLQMFMNCMPGRYRVLFTLRVILGFNVVETCEILECGEASVKTGLHRARRLVRDHFDGRCSLVRKDGPCVCSSYASHILHRGHADRLANIRAVPMEEVEATQCFHRELEAILDHEALYLAEIHGQGREEFLAHVQKLREEGGIHLLSE